MVPASAFTEEELLGKRVLFPDGGMSGEDVFGTVGGIVGARCVSVRWDDGMVSAISMDRGLVVLEDGEE